MKHQSIIGFLYLVLTNISYSQIDHAFDGQIALNHIKKQVSLGPRSITMPETKALTHRYIVNTLSKYTNRLISQPFEYNKLKGNNIWATFPRENKSGTDMRFMLGAHWDTRPQSELDDNQKNRDVPSPGANDGGSGVAMLLEIARILSMKPAPVTVDLIFFDLEDLGNIGDLPFAIGAEQFVKKNSFYKPDKGIIVDMVCDKNLVIPKELFSKKYSRELQNEIWAVAKTLGATVFSDENGTHIIDDHLPLIEAGMNVVNLIHYPFPSYWHTTYDTPKNCSVDSLSQVGNVILTLIYNQDNT